MDNWQSIETAPIDTEVIAYDKDTHEIYMAQKTIRFGRKDWSLCGSDRDPAINPSYWMPLPDPPNFDLNGKISEKII
jgi:hypothetical protein